MLNVRDEKYKLNIISYTPSTQRDSFKAYLEDHSVQYQIVEQQLQYAPLSFVNDKVHMRTNQTISMRFNVFSEDLAEAQSNYDKLHKLVEWIKPTYGYRMGQYIANVENNTGIIGVKFAGLPKVHSSNDELKLHLTSFTFSVNKEMGYIETEYVDSRVENVIQDGLVPIAYTLEIGGRILLEFKETARITGGPKQEKKKAEKYIVFSNSEKYNLYYLGLEEGVLEDIKNNATRTALQALARQFSAEYSAAPDDSDKQIIANDYTYKLTKLLASDE